MFLTNLSKPTGTVAAVGAGILSIVIAIATAIAALPPGTLQTAFDFRKNPVQATLAICSIIVAIGAIIKAGAGRSFVPSVDGVQDVTVPLNSTVTLSQVGTTPVPKGA